MLRGLPLALCLFTAVACAADDKGPKFVQTPYSEPKVLFDFYLDDPNEMGSALFWLRSYIGPLMEQPYNMAPEFMEIIVVVHGTELVTLAKKNEPKYKEAVDRMRYYADLGVKFKVCGLAMDDFGYESKDLQPFVEIVPSAMTELVHWQLQGYALLTPKVLSKKFSTEEIR